MMMTMFNTHIQTTNIWIVSMWKIIQRKNHVFGFQNRKKQGVHCKQIQVGYQVVTFGLLSTPCLDQINISLLMLPF
jgi:hypothetical protein